MLSTASSLTGLGSLLNRSLVVRIIFDELKRAELCIGPVLRRYQFPAFRSSFGTLDVPSRASKLATVRPVLGEVMKVLP